MTLKTTSQAKPTCTACADTGSVLDIHSLPRPCSRCNWTAFDRWYAARVPRPSSAGPTTPSTPGAA